MPRSAADGLLASRRSTPAPRARLLDPVALSHPHAVILVAIALLLPAAARAQRTPGAPSCERARAEHRAALARARATAPITLWSAAQSAQTSSGAQITQGQRTLYDRTRDALASASLALDSLRPLHPDGDEATLAETRPVLLAQLTLLSDELGRDDGPRPDVVDRALTDAHALLTRLGLTLCRGGAVDVEAAEETYRRHVHVEHVLTMARRDWIAAGPPRIPPLAAAPVPQAMPELQPAALVDLSSVADSLDAVMQALEQVASAIDVLQLTPEQRDAIGAETRDGRRFALGELLPRIERFAAEDAPRSLETGGAVLLPSLRATADTLRHLARALHVPEAPPDAEPESDARAAVSRLADRLDGLYRLLESPPRQ